MKLLMLAALLLPALAFATESDGELEATFKAIPGMSDYVARISQSKDRIADVAADPARFVSERTYLRDPKAFRAFLRNRRAVDSFLGDGVTRYVVEHGWAVKQLARPKVVEAVLASPAMRDRKVVSYLFTKSALPLQLERAPGVKEALADKEFVESVCTPEVRSWLAANPAAAVSLKSQSPAFAAALARR